MGSTYGGEIAIPSCSVLCHWEIWAKYLKSQGEVTKWMSYLRIISRGFRVETIAVGSVGDIGQTLRVSRPLSLYLADVTSLGLKQVFSPLENIPAGC